MEQYLAIALGCHKVGYRAIRTLGEKNIPVEGIYSGKIDMDYVSKYAITRYCCPNPDNDEKGFIVYLIIS